MGDRLKDCIKIGLVTHAKSSYLDSKSNHELFKDLIRQLNLNSYYISDLDVTSPEMEQIYIKRELKSLYILFLSIITTQINLLYLTKFRSLVNFFDQTLNSIYIISHLLIKLFLSRFFEKSNYEYRSVMSRQYNISESHIAQFQDSVRSNFEFSLILEDDFRLNLDYEINETINSLLEFLKLNNDTSIISISKSFSFSELGVSKAVTQLNYHNLNFFSPRLPVTNTVSAMLYRTQVLNQMLPYLLEYRKYKIIPIDHKINMALYQLYKRKNFGSNFFYYMQPGLFIQESIHGR